MHYNLFTQEGIEIFIFEQTVVIFTSLYYLQYQIYRFERRPATILKEYFPIFI